MIRIDVTNKEKYFSIREEYLNRISSYVKFNKEDIIYGDIQEIHSKVSNSTENMTEKSAEKLEKDFPGLYEYLFDIRTHKLKREKLRLLLIGPDEMPKSFGGSGEDETMKGYLKNIIHECPLPDDSVKKTKAKECCEDIFNYKKFVREQNDAYWLLRNLNVRVCPYCNRIYTVTLPSPEEVDKDEIFRASRATFDHFFCQSRFPYLALSLFNLVPSCFSCNMSKKDYKEDIIYPYEEEFGKEVVFRVIPDMEGVTLDDPCNILGFLHGENDHFHIRFMSRNLLSLRKNKLLEDRLSGILKNGLRNSIQASIDALNLEQLYKEHKMEIREILRNRYYFDEQYIKTVVCPIIQQKVKKKNREINEKELERMAMNMLFFTHINESDWGKRPLSKLVADILQQVEVCEFE